MDFPFTGTARKRLFILVIRIIRVIRDPTLLLFIRVIRLALCAIRVIRVPGLFLVLLAAAPRRESCPRLRSFHSCNSYNSWYP
jgi:type IV secretory pathway VirB3-like protein